MAAGTTPAAMIAETVAAQSSTVGKVHEQRADRGRERDQPNADPGHDAEGALRADHEAAEVEPGGLGRLGAEAFDRAVREHEVEREHVVRRHAVREAVGPAGVRGHVAADRAALLRGGVGREHEPVPGDGVHEVEVQHAGLDPREAVVRSDLEDPVHLGRAHDERIADRRCPAGEPGAGAARHDGEAVLGGDAETRRDVLRGSGEYDERTSALDHRGVAGVQREGERVREHLGRARASSSARRAASTSAMADGVRLARAGRGGGEARVLQATRPGEPSGVENGRPSRAQSSMPPSRL